MRVWRNSSFTNFTSSAPTPVGQALPFEVLNSLSVQIQPLTLAENLAVPGKANTPEISKLKVVKIVSDCSIEIFEPPN
tara:strand:- start:2301 stop:2534 length:234 start_codon:yes stop_codon:yes gene_type:complete